MKGIKSALGTGSGSNRRPSIKLCNSCDGKGCESYFNGHEEKKYGAF